MSPCVLTRRSCTDTSPLLDRSPSYCRITGDSGWVYRSHALSFLRSERNTSLCFLTPRCRAQPLLQRSGWHFLSLRESPSCRRRRRRRSSSSRCSTAARTPSTWDGGHRRRGGTRRESVRVTLQPFCTFYAPLKGLTVSGLFSLTRIRELCDAFGKHFPTSSS